MDISQMTDMNELHKLYVENNEALLGLERAMQARQQNLGLVRQRLAELEKMRQQTSKSKEMKTRDNSGDK